MIKPNPFGMKQVISYLEALKINHAKCLKNISPLAKCNLCKDTCPKKGLTFQEGKWVVDDCSLCGTCVAICPEEVFQIDEQAILNQLKKDERLVLTCVNDDKTDFGIKINCFKELTPEFLFRLQAYSEKVVLAVDKASCEACQNNWSKQMLLLMLERYHLPYDGLTIATEPSELMEVKSLIETSRRSYLKQSYQAFLNTGADMAIHGLKESQAYLEERYSRRFYLYHLYRDKMSAGETLPYPILKINHCHFCGACEKLCPREALKIVDLEDKKHLLFQPILCTQCKLCEEVCVVKGLQFGEFVTHEVFFSGKWKELARSEKRICESCGQEYYSAEEKTVCFLCEEK